MRIVGVFHGNLLPSSLCDVGENHQCHTFHVGQDAAWVISDVCTKPRPPFQPWATAWVCCLLYPLSVWAWACIPKPDLAPSSSGPPRCLGCTKACAHEGRPAGGPSAWHGHGYVGAWQDHGSLWWRGHWFGAGHGHYGTAEKWEGVR